MSDIEKIKLQINKIKKMIREDKENDKKIISNLNNQLKKVDKSILALNQLSQTINKIKGGKLKSQRRKPTCKSSLSKKISVNMKEYKKGKWKNRKQAIAVSYNQIQKERPGCKKVLKRKKNKK